MSEENEIQFPLRKDDFTRRGGLYQAIKEALPYAPDKEIERFVKGLKNTAKGSVSKNEMKEYLEYLEEQRGDYFMHTQCKEIADRLEVRFT